MKSKALVVLLATIFCLAATLAGCGTSTATGTQTDKTAQTQSTDTAKEGSTSATQTNTKPTLKIGLAADIGGINDRSFNQSAWQGLQKAEKELGIKASVIEAKQASDYGPNLENLYDAKNDLIWALGFMMSDSLKAAAEANTDAKYAIVDVSYGDKTPPNTIGVLFQAEQSSFLVGYIAGKMTKTNKVGFVGGIKGNVIDSFEYGYRSGVMYANKNAEVTVQYADSFTDAAKGKAIANQMYQNKADIIFQAAGPAGLGVIESAKENNKYVIGVDQDQGPLAPDNVITSAMKRVDNGVCNIIKAMQDGTIKFGTTVVYGLKEGGVDFTTSKLIPADVLDQANALKQDIVNEKITVPYDEKTYNDFIGKLK